MKEKIICYMGQENRECKERVAGQKVFDKKLQQGQQIFVEKFSFSTGHVVN